MVIVWYERGVNLGYGGNHFAVRKCVRSACCTPWTHPTLYVIISQ